MNGDTTGPRQKAFAINLDRSIYGTFAEIGAGQEVARWFFRVGGSAGTIAKTMSAYDMAVSDAIYGANKRYVSRERLVSMLDHEFDLLRERLGSEQGQDRRFFAFADTVTARSYQQKNECHGWLGIRFQTRPGSEPSEIIIHIRMLDPENVQQQEALGIIGVNLIHGAYHHYEDPIAIITHLMDDLSHGRMEVDMIKFSGLAFEQIDNRLMTLKLVELGHSPAAMFTAEGETVQPAEFLYKKPILVERGSFRPVTRATLDMLHCATAHFVQEPKVQDDEIVVLMEMTLHNLVDGDRIDHRDFLERADTLCALGHNVLISNFGEFHRLAAYLFRYTKKMIGITMGVPTLREIFNEDYYKDLEGGILESFGRLFKNDLKLYIYPWREPKNGSLITAGNLRVESHLKHLYAYLLENHFFQGLRDINESYLPIYSRDVLRSIREGDSQWESQVPEVVAKMIKERKLFGHP